MHSSYWQTTNQGGDLGDIVRPLVAAASSSNGYWRTHAPAAEEMVTEPPAELPDPMLPVAVDSMEGVTVAAAAAAAVAGGVCVLPPAGEMLSATPPLLLQHGLKSDSSLLPCCNSLSGQISSPRAVKRRKSQTKRVVCVPAPANTGCRQTGEVVPSDLWAWRKYGQKPIKGSPYPRGYYRCSSSKGCSARKQVERSRTNPNILVITYTSEHNHPWPTHRNALAGSTRSHHLKNPSTSSTLKSTSLDNPADCQTTYQIDMISGEQLVKEEALDQILAHQEQHEIVSEHEYHTDDLFADLGELAPMDFAISKEFLEGRIDEDPMRMSKTLDPFSFFDWGGSSSFETQTNKPDV